MNAHFERDNLTFGNVATEEASKASFLADIMSPGGYSHVNAQEETIEVHLAADVDPAFLGLVLRNAGVELNG